MKINNLEEAREKINQIYEKEVAKVNAMSGEEAKQTLLDAHKTARDAALEEVENLNDALGLMRERLDDFVRTVNKPSKDDWIFPAVCGMLFGLGVVLGLNL